MPALFSCQESEVCTEAQEYPVWSGITINIKYRTYRPDYLKGMHGLRMSDENNGWLPYNISFPYDTIQKALLQILLPGGIIRLLTLQDQWIIRRDVKKPRQ